MEVEGTAAAHADHSAPLRKEAGEPVEIAVDLTWETDGVPYQWRLATRYEIPCRVSGTVRVGEEEFELSGPGQRDHSWGARDWWASDWMWSALHLDDGTHTHAVSVPTHPDFGVGYVQRDGELTELANVNSSEQVADNGLITTGRIAMSPVDIDVELEPLAFGAILLEAPDGRISHFPRAMCRVRATDGRRASAGSSGTATSRRRELAEQALELLQRVRLRRGCVDDEAMLGALLRHEDRVLEDELADLRVVEDLAAHAARCDLVQLPPLAELGARLLKG